MRRDDDTSRYGLVAAPRYVGWVRHPQKGWRSEGSGDDAEELLATLRGFHGKAATVRVLRPGQRPEAGEA
jgi:hypothetical protein